jgi:hypothetical protein
MQVDAGISSGTIVHTVLDQADAASVLLSCNITNCLVPISYNNLQTAANHSPYPHWQSRLQPAGHAKIDKVDKLRTIKCYTQQAMLHISQPTNSTTARCSSGLGPQRINQPLGGRSDMSLGPETTAA